MNYETWKKFGNSSKDQIFSKGIKIKIQKEKEEKDGEIRKKELWKPYQIRTEEQKRLDHLALDLKFEKYCYMCIKHFIERDQYYYAEQVLKILEDNKKGRK